MNYFSFRVRSDIPGIYIFNIHKGRVQSMFISCNVCFPCVPVCVLLASSGMKKKLKPKPHTHSLCDSPPPPPPPSGITEPLRCAFCSFLFSFFFFDSPVGSQRTQNTSGCPVTATTKKLSRLKPPHQLPEQGKLPSLRYDLLFVLVLPSFL